MGYPTNDDLKAMLTKAAEYKKAEADRIQAMITEAKTRAERLEAELKRWEAFTPHNVYEEMQENDRRKTWETEHREEQEYQSCHTAEIGGYVIEGHVPASDIKRLLKDKPHARGLTVPGMPVGSPGMEQGGHKDAYEVILLDKNGGAPRVYSRY